MSFTCVQNPPDHTLLISEDPAGDLSDVALRKVSTSALDTSDDTHPTMLEQAGELGFCRKRMVEGVLSRSSNAYTSTYYLILLRYGRARLTKADSELARLQALGKVPPTSPRICPHCNTACGADPNFRRRTGHEDGHDEDEHGARTARSGYKQPSDSSKPQGGPSPSGIQKMPSTTTADATGALTAMGDKGRAGAADPKNPPRSKSAAPSSRQARAQQQQGQQRQDQPQASAAATAMAWGFHRGDQSSSGSGNGAPAATPFKFLFGQG